MDTMKQGILVGLNQRGLIFTSLPYLWGYWMSWPRYHKIPFVCTNPFAVVLQYCAACRAIALYHPGANLSICDSQEYGSCYSGVDKRVVFQKGGFGGCSPGTKTGTRVYSDVLPERKPQRGYDRMFPWNENRNEGTFAKTTLLRNRPCWD